ncbi:DinB family protein [Paenibacillus sp. P26]|nr:DinB family protein [Paenibacillus sp. P26]
MPLWQEVGPAECARLAEHNRKGFAAYLDSLTEEDLDRVVTYRNQTGREYSTSIRDILTHLALHGQYHRGQINTLLRTEGMEPVNVDFITFVRNGG